MRSGASLGEAHARLPVDTVTVRTIVGSGTATAVLEDNTLTVTGKFEGMNSPATIARISPGAERPSGSERLRLDGDEGEQWNPRGPHQTEPDPDR